MGRSKTGGGRGTNQFAVKGVSAQSSASAPSPVIAASVGDGGAASDPFADDPPPSEACVGRLMARFDDGPRRPRVEYDPSWMQACTKCDGSGSYTSPNTGGGGQCSVCSGSGRTLTSAGRRERDRARVDAVDRAREAARADLRARPELAEALDSILERNASEDDAVRGQVGGFAADVANKWRIHGSLTDRQADALVRWRANELDRHAKAQERAVQRAAAGPAPSGRIEFDATVVKAEMRDNRFSGGSEYKMLIEHADGWRAWATVPRDLVPDPNVGLIDALAGAPVSLRATLEPTDDDPSFAIAKHPRAQRPDGFDDRVGTGTAAVLAGRGLTGEQVTAALDALPPENPDRFRVHHNASYIIGRIAKGESASMAAGRPDQWRAAHAALRRAGADVADLRPPDGKTDAEWDAEWDRKLGRRARNARVGGGG